MQKKKNLLYKSILNLQAYNYYSHQSKKLCHIFVFAKRFDALKWKKINEVKIIVCHSNRKFKVDFLLKIVNF